MVKEHSEIQADGDSDGRHTAVNKRSAHNALERQRREGLNSKFQQLARVLPGMHNVQRPSKNMIVAKSLEFVNKAVQRDFSYANILKRLRKEHETLMRHAQRTSGPPTRKRKSAQSVQEESSVERIKKQKLITPSKPITTSTVGLIHQVHQSPKAKAPVQMCETTQPMHAGYSTPNTSATTINSPTFRPIIHQQDTQYGIFQQFTLLSPTLNMFPIHQSWPPLDLSACPSTTYMTLNHINSWETKPSTSCTTHGQ
ncbi:hypothetical protein BC940DRAFT_31641 [Gongronella butleri]|nr:hypothetical protein BC940DRAFT_31641 [Gongronella butleri]